MTMPRPGNSAQPKRGSKTPRPTSWFFNALTSLAFIPTCSTCVVQARADVTWSTPSW